MTEAPAKPKRIRKKPEPLIWCDHCNCHLKPSAVRSCERVRCVMRATVKKAQG